MYVSFDVKLKITFVFAVKSCGPIGAGVYKVPPRGGGGAEFIELKYQGVKRGSEYQGREQGRQCYLPIDVMKEVRRRKKCEREEG